MSDEVKPVTLWRYDEPYDGVGSHYVEGDHLSTDAEYRALPAAEFDALLAERSALVARLARAEEERDEAVGRTSMDRYSDGRVGEARMESVVYDLGVCSNWYFDDYDCSVEMTGVRNGWLPTKEERDLLSATGLCGAFLSYSDGTGVLVNLITGEHGPCSPSNTASDKSALVAKLERERDAARAALSPTQPPL